MTRMILDFSGDRMDKSDESFVLFVTEKKRTFWIESSFCKNNRMTRIQHIHVPVLMVARSEKVARCCKGAVPTCRVGLQCNLLFLEIE